jgi:hypothetical protein
MFALSREMTVTKPGLADRTAELRESASGPGGDDVERGRWLLGRGRTDEAMRALERAIDTGRGTPIEATARGVMHSTALEAALETADLANPDRDEEAALTMLERLGAEPADAAVFTGRVARATLLALRGERASADEAMAAALDDWIAHQSSARAASTPPAAGTLEADVLAIRGVVFTPLGGGVYAAKGWNAFDWPSALPRYMVANPEVVVKQTGGQTTTLTLRQPVAGYTNIVFATRRELDVLTKVIRALGGTARGQPASIMSTPNQPRGRSQDINAFWNGYFPMRPGHWSGWELETYPTITDVEFLDDARTKAAVRVTIGYSGGTVLLVKENGTWRATELTGLWIT